jgi:hypothetical protein
VFVVFGRGNDIYAAASQIEEGSFGTPVRVGSPGILALGMRRGPRVAASANFVAVTAIGGKLGGGKDGDVWSWRSIDRGKTWTGPVRVNDEAGSAREGLHAMASGPRGEIFCAWLDLRNGKTELFGASSEDGGKTWSASRRVYRSPEGSICECCHPSVEFDDRGRLFVMWRNQLAGNRDMYLAHSDDLGQTFSEGKMLGEGTWRLRACPMDGGAIAAAGPDGVSTVWRREKTVYFTDATSSREQTLGEGVQPWAARSRRGLYSVWLTQRPGDLMVRGPRDREPRRIASGAVDPMVASGGRGTAVLVWEQPGPAGPSIAVSFLDSSR